MRSSPLLLLIALYTLGFSVAIVRSAIADNDVSLPWLEQYDAAAAASKSTGKPILAFFTGSDWCEWCAKLDQQVFETETFKSWADEHVVLLKIDFPRTKKQSDDLKKQNMRLKDKYDVQGLPSVLFLDAEGKVLASTGYKPGGADKWIEHADHLLNKSKK